jgi:hypothetical protein
MEFLYIIQKGSNNGKRFNGYHYNYLELIRPLNFQNKIDIIDIKNLNNPLRDFYINDVLDINLINFINTLNENELIKFYNIINENNEFTTEKIKKFMNKNNDKDNKIIKIRNYYYYNNYNNKKLLIKYISKKYYNNLKIYKIYKKNKKKQDIIANIIFDNLTYKL